MEDPPVADPERDVIGSLPRAVGDEVPRANVCFLELFAGFLLLIRISRHELSASAERHVDEAGAVDPGRGHPAPLVRRAEQRSRVLDRLGCDRPEPVGVALAAEVAA